MLISDWSSDVCSSDLLGDAGDLRLVIAHRIETLAQALVGFPEPARLPEIDVARQFANDDQIDRPRDFRTQGGRIGKLGEKLCRPQVREQRSEEHTSELQSLMRISYAVFCLKKKNKN